ncbi:MAG: hypothetical protein K2M07_01760 [Muribaculaceae bacterium]|nr:hypothetical protein [Muribaculaceae bacterium]
MKHLSIIALTLLALFTSCNRNGGEKSVYDYIPAESDGVARVNVDAILKNSGCRIRDGKVTLSPSMELLLGAATPGQQEFFTAIVDLYPILDMENVVITAYGDRPVGVTTVRNPELMERYLDENGVLTEVSGREIYATSTLAIAEDDGIAVIAESPELIAGIMQEADENPLSADQELTGFLKESEMTVSAYYRSKTTPNRHDRQESMAEGYNSMRLTIDLHERFLDAELTMFDTEGYPVDITRFIPPADPDVISSIPAGAQGVAVMGESPDINGLMRYLHPALSSIIRKYNEWMFVTDFISGSFMISATPAATGTYLRKMTPPAWNITGTMTLTDGNLSSILSMLSMFGGGSKSRNADEEEGQMRYNLTPDISLYLLQTPPLLTVSTDYIRTPEMESGYADLFYGASFGVAINIPYNSETMRAFNLPYGPSVAIIGRDTSITMRLSLNGSKTALLEALAETIREAR